MLVSNQLARVFLFEDNGQEISLADPDNGLSPDAVLNFYSTTYPILTTAQIEGPKIQDDAVQYRFLSTIGTKG